jgi:hypothetical protein
VQKWLDNVIWLKETKMFVSSIEFGQYPWFLWVMLLGWRGSGSGLSNVGHCRTYFLLGGYKTNSIQNLKKVALLGSVSTWHRIGTQKGVAVHLQMIPTTNSTQNSVYDPHGSDDPFRTITIKYHHLDIGHIRTWWYGGWAGYWLEELLVLSADEEFVLGVTKGDAPIAPY